MEVSLMTPEKVVWSGTTSGVDLIGEKGQLQILPRHANLITLVKSGPLTVHGSGSAQKFRVGEGVLKVEEEKVSVLCQEISESR